MAEPGQLSRTAYENAFINAPNPRQTHTLLSQRIQSASKLNDHLADIFKERAQIETKYIADLQKLHAKKGLQDGGVAQTFGGRAGEELGGFKTVWEKVWGEIDSTAQLHTSLARKMAEEVEAPLRRMNGKGKWAELSVFDSNIERTLKTLDSAQNRFNKAQKKVDSSRKEKTVAELTDSQAALADAQQGWIIESPQVLSLYQQIDEHRLQELKEIFTKWETSRSDCARMEMEGSEAVMMRILGWDTMEDLQDFLVRKGVSGAGMGMYDGGSGNAGGGAGRTPVVPMMRSETGSSSQNGNRMVSNASVMTRATSVRRQNSVISSPSKNMANNHSSSDFGPSHNASSSSGSGLGALKSVFGKKNRDRAGSSATNGSSGPGGRPAGANSTDSYGGGGGMVGSGSIGGGGGGFSTLGDGPDERPYERDENGSRRREQERERESRPMESPQAMVDEEGYSIPPPDHDKNPWEQNANPSNLMDDDDNDGNGGPFTAEPQSALSNLKLATAPIQETEEERRAALARVQSTLLAPSPGGGPQRRGTVARGRRDVRNTTFGMPGGVPDDMPLGQAMAMGAYGGGKGGGSVSSRSGSMGGMGVLDEQYQQQQQQTSSSPTTPSFNTAPPLANSIAAPSPSMMGSSAFASPSLITTSPPPMSFSPNPNNNANNPFGLPSSSTATSPINGGSLPPIPPASSSSYASNPPAAEGRLRLAISETCNVVSRSGAIVKCMIAGQIDLALPLPPASSSLSSGTLHIRIDAFEQLEKVAPNPQFVKPFSPSDRAGEYLLDLTALNNASASGAINRAVLFKYQLHIGEGKASTLVPLTVVPQWKCEDDATKLLITYSSNPSSNLFSASSSSSSSSPFEDDDASSSRPQIANLLFTCPISSPSGITKPQSKPFPGEYDASAKTIAYPGEDLSSDEGEKKIVARMSVQEPSVPQPIQVRWSVKGGLCSTLGVSVVGGGGGGGGEAFKFAEVGKSLQSGKFFAE